MRLVACYVGSAEGRAKSKVSGGTSGSYLRLFQMNGTHLAVLLAFFLPCVFNQGPQLSVCLPCTAVVAMMTSRSRGGKLRARPPLRHGAVSSQS